MDKDVFSRLLGLVWDDLKKNDDMDRRAKRPTIQRDTKLAVTLRMLVGEPPGPHGSFPDI